MEAQAIGGSHDAIEALYRAHGDRIWRAVLAYAQDPEVASDAVSEAFAQAIVRGDGLRSPVSWVWRSAFRIAAGMLEERSRSTSLLGTESYEMPAAAGTWSARWPDCRPGSALP